MEGKDPTIYEVAQHAQVSISTVSLALNNPSRVRKDTLDRVLAAADQLGYVPKVNAVMQARRGLGRIAAIAPFTSYPSFSRRLAGALEVLKDSPTQIIVSDVDDVAVADSPVLKSLPIRGHVDGLLNLGVPMEPAIGERLKSRLPTVLMDVVYPGIPTIAANFRDGGRLIAEHLLGLGHRRIAYLREAERFHPESPTLACLEGLRGALGKENVREIQVERGVDAGRAAVDTFLRDSPRETAVVGSRDLVAIGAIAEFRRRGVDVPNDISVVGVDDDPVAEALGLTTLRYPYEESGRLGIQMLQQMILDPRANIPDQHIKLNLIARDTTTSITRQPGL
jgi:DNA-binding LacI/PurR family transcriptional regulator